MGNVGKKQNGTSISGTELKVDIDKLDKNIEEMSSLCVSTMCFTSEMSFANSKGSSIDSMLNIYDQFVRLQDELTELYFNTSVALQMTKDTYNEVDHKLGNFFKELK